MRIDKVLTLLGLIMVWVTLIIPVVLSFIVLVQRSVFLFDFLMPAEMSFVFFIGAFLLLWISRKKGMYFKFGNHNSCCSTVGCTGISCYNRTCFWIY
ncbi:hypothetical protein Theth_1486 [Pseudothermotoga thermarum DSM 5069]|uniref:Uncharacterized protein n=1 Tax=Pseudothermotoga thermarum DSM 5069 TaxID=688269 RepID=F7YUX9_9THEM|nr:hypothetical protein Theth_1486 [Pseudothermotoga thermarum DSM 5069]